MSTPIRTIALSLAAAGLCALSALPVQAADVNSELAELRQATASFHALDHAVRAGWDEDITGCMASPDGGMGHHYANWDALLDGGQVEATRPELLVYAPHANGGLRLVAVEYLVWASDVAIGAPPPQLFGQSFHYNPDVDAWVLHAWVWRHNPSGMFADWNPNVSCPMN